MNKILLSIIFIFYIGQIANAKIISDIDNRKIKIPENIERVVALGPGALRFLAYIDEIEKLCGVERIEFKLLQGVERPYSLVVKKKIKSLPIISEGGPGKMPYFEKLTFVKPDIIIGVGFTKRQAELIEEKIGIPVVLLSYGNLGRLNGKFIDSLLVLGKIFNKSDRAQKLIDYIVNIESDLKQRTSRIKTVKKVYIGGIAYKGLHDITSTDTNFTPLKWLNVKNVVSSLTLQGHVFINWENLIIWNPDYIFIDKTSLPIVKKNISSNRYKYYFLRAFKENKVFLILPYNYYNTNVELSFIISYCIGKKVYPSRFKDVNLKNKFNEILYKFLKFSVKSTSIFCGKFTIKDSY